MNKAKAKEWWFFFMYKESQKKKSWTLKQYNMASTMNHTLPFAHY